MDFKNKYLKYKMKYLSLKDNSSQDEGIKMKDEGIKMKYLDLKNNTGGFIKTNTKNPLDEQDYNSYIDIDNIDDSITLKAECKDDKKIIYDIVNYYMPLYKISNDDSNFILINDENYILVDHRKNDRYQLLRLKQDFSIEIVPVPYPVILDDNITINNIDSNTKTHDILESYYLYKNSFFLQLVNIDFKDNKYYYYNKLINELYKNIGVADKPILYNNSTDNFILKLIFINKLPKIIDILNNFDNILNLDTRDYKINNRHPFSIERDKTKKKKLIDYIRGFKNVKKLQNKDFDNVIQEIQDTIYSLNDSHTDQADIPLIFKIIKYVYTYVNSEPNFVYQYNYTNFIQKYNYTFIRKNKEGVEMDPTYKKIKDFINEKYDEIKLELIYELVYYLYILYKTNNEFTKEYTISQYLLFDYFLGCTKDKIIGFPINRRQTFVKIRNLEATDNLVIDYTSLLLAQNAKYIIFFSKNANYQYIAQSRMFDILKNRRYVDCGERTLLNIFTYFLIDEKGNINIESTNFNNRLKIFFKTWKTIQLITVPSNIDNMKKDWGKVVENIPELIGDTSFYSAGYPITTYNINPTKENFIRISKILLNLKGDVTFKDILKRLNPTIEDSKIIEVREGGYDCIKYGEIVIQCSYEHAEFNLTPINIDYVYLNKYNHLYRINQSPYNITLIPEQDLNDEICLIAVNENGLLLNYIFESKRTPLVCFTAVNQNGKSIQYVPKQFLSEELYCTAVKSNAFSIQFVPKDLQTEELYLIAVNKSGLSLEYIHESKRTKLVCCTAVKQNGQSIKYVPTDLQIEELCLIAVNQHGLNLNLIDETKRTPLVCRTAVNNHAPSIEYVPIDRQIEELCLIAVNRYGFLLSSIHPSKRTLKVCLTALTAFNGEINLNLIEEVPIEHQEEVYLNAINNNSEVLSNIKFEDRTSKMYYCALNKNDNIDFYKNLGYTRFI